jgi:hypothetical protein
MLETQNCEKKTIRGLPLLGQIGQSVLEQSTHLGLTARS